MKIKSSPLGWISGYSSHILLERKCHFKFSPSQQTRIDCDEIFEFVSPWIGSHFHLIVVTCCLRCQLVRKCCDFYECVSLFLIESNFQLGAGAVIRLVRCWSSSSVQLRRVLEQKRRANSVARQYNKDDFDYTLSVQKSMLSYSMNKRNLFRKHVIIAPLHEEQGEGWRGRRSSWAAGRQAGRVDEINIMWSR